MYIDWNQMERLPNVSTLIDIGVGPDGTPELYDHFPDSRLVLIDPLDEAEAYFENKIKGGREARFIKAALGAEDGEAELFVEPALGRSTLMQVADINWESEPTEVRHVPMLTLDSAIASAFVSEVPPSDVGIKIDAEGFELEIIKGATQILQNARFVLAEVRHNHESFKGVYSLSHFVNEMYVHGFALTIIMTAKPFIADLVFEPLDK